VIEPQVGENQEIGVLKLAETFLIHFLMPSEKLTLELDGVGEIQTYVFY
jgi:hypothetical protein